MTTSTIEQRVKQILVEQLGVEEDEVTPEAKLVDDLGADSLDCCQLVMDFEYEFDLDVPDEDAEKIETVQQIVDYVTKSLKGEKV